MKKLILLIILISGYIFSAPDLENLKKVLMLEHYEQNYQNGSDEQNNILVKNICEAAQREGGKIVDLQSSMIQERQDKIGQFRLLYQKALELMDALYDRHLQGNSILFALAHPEQIKFKKKDLKEICDCKSTMQDCVNKINQLKAAIRKIGKKTYSDFTYIEFEDDGSLTSVTLRQGKYSIVYTPK